MSTSSRSLQSPSVREDPRERGASRYVFEGKIYPGYKGTPDWWVEGQPKREVNWYAGKQYDDDMANAMAALKDIARWFPGYKDQGYDNAETYLETGLRLDWAMAGLLKTE